MRSTRRKSFCLQILTSLVYLDILKVLRPLPSDSLLEVSMQSHRAISRCAATTAVFACSAFAGTTAHAGSFVNDGELLAAERFAETGQFDTVGELLVRDTDNNLFSASATLIGKRFLLTAAHNLDGISNVNFSHNGSFLQASRWWIHQDFQSDWIQGNTGGDIAVILLDEKVQGVTPSRIYNNRRVDNKEFEVAGYGRYGTGTSGAVNQGNGQLRAGRNEVDGFFSFERDLATFVGVPRSRSFFYSDFDGGNADPSATPDSADDYPLNLEWAGAPGDSGGPSFIDGRIAGLSSFIVGEIDSTQPGQFGSKTFSTNVGFYAKWVNRVVEKAQNGEFFYTQEYGPLNPFDDGLDADAGNRDLIIPLNSPLSASVPEPGSALLAAVGACLVNLRRRRP